MRAFNKKSLSLIEVGIALVLLALILTGMLRVFSQGFAQSRKTQESTSAVSLAREVLEFYYDWNELDDLDGTSDGVVTNGTYNPAAFNINNVNYTFSLVVSDGPVSPTRLKQLSLTTTWVNGAITINTLKANY